MCEVGYLTENVSMMVINTGEISGTFTGYILEKGEKLIITGEQKILGLYFVTDTEGRECSINKDKVKIANGNIQKI